MNTGTTKNNRVVNKTQKIYRGNNHILTLIYISSGHCNNL